jgi:hypothetical protein
MSLEEDMQLFCERHGEDIFERSEELRMCPTDIVVLDSLGIDCNKYKENPYVFSNMLRAIKNVYDYTPLSGCQFWGAMTMREFSYIATGAQGVLVRFMHEAWKFSEDPATELELILMVGDSRPTNVVRPRSLKVTDGFFKLIFVPGCDMQSLVYKSGPIEKDSTLKYAGGVFNGLQELRQAGIYHHRDIRPANIMLDRKNDRAVIIDLGIATTNKYAEEQDNCRFGGPNDLVSLGQVMYFMSTQQHLFTESDSMHVTRIKQDLKDERDIVYADETGKLLVPYLEKVEQNVGGEVAGVIGLCLRADGSDYSFNTVQDRFTPVNHGVGGLDD